MPPDRTLLALAVVLIMAAPASAETYRQVATIQIPGAPVVAFAGLAIDQASGLGYLADKDNRGVVVFDTRSDKFVSRIEGFVGLTKSGNTSGPNGILVVKGGAELWVSDGDSTIKVVDLKSHRVAATFSTGGKRRANGMAVDSAGRTVLVVNSNDDPPFISLVSTGPDRKIVARIPVVESGENLERSAYHEQSGTFFTAIPVLRTDATKGLLAQTSVGKPIKLNELDGCHPHSLQIVSATTIFLGCSSAHGPNRKPGGDMAVFDIPSGTIVSRHANQGGNGGSALNPKLGRYYHSASHGSLVVVDTGTGKLVQRVPTSRGARSSAASHANNRVYVATSAKTGPCGGCIMVYAAE
jgi:DNA-binding beta-propeller fold protein YncE